MRDIWISDDAASILTANKSNALRTGPGPGLTSCARCEQPVDVEAEPVSVLAVRHPTPGGGTVTDILFAHAACVPSAVSDSDVVVDIAAVMERMRLIPTVTAAADGPVAAGLLMEPLFPGVEKADAPTTAYLTRLLRHGLPLLSVHDVDDLVPVPGWRAGLPPGERPHLLRATITCDRDAARTWAVNRRGRCRDRRRPELGADHLRQRRDPAVCRAAEDRPGPGSGPDDRRARGRYRCPAGEPVRRPHRGGPHRDLTVRAMPSAA